MLHFYVHIISDTFLGGEESRIRPTKFRVSNGAGKRDFRVWKQRLKRGGGIADLPSDFKEKAPTGTAPHRTGSSLRQQTPPIHPSSILAQVRTASTLSSPPTYASSFLTIFTPRRAPIDQGSWGDSGVAFLSWQAREGGDEEEGARTGLLRRRRPPPQPPAPSAPPATEGDNNSTSKEKKKGEITKTIRDRLSSSFSSPRSRLSCWTSHPIRRSRRGSGTASDEHGTPVTAKAIRPPSRKVVAAGTRSLIERNDFYSQECNTHK
ncbi:hypothetical protein CFC21_035081 [Triticum aestivum]|uniref:Uncharacterized protein n=3 Tax=Triticum TaxID=4564 RepID=A0A9R0RGF8_TRITD|nr:hypothetical protein CFC21_035081 [Triticum aestivum]VAH60031.1 unnamed protein product [Triticum turgidum subsp. durum]